MIKKIINISIFSLIFALYFFSALMIFSNFKERELDSLEEGALDTFESEVKVVEDAKEKEVTTSTKVSYKNYTIIGKIEIPKISFNSVIIKENTYAAMNVGVVKSYGVDINEEGGFVISGHNFRGKSVFMYNIKNLKVGDSIYITDTSGFRLEYTIYEVNRNVNPTDTSYMRTFDGYHVTLITCENGGKARIMVKAKIN